MHLSGSFVAIITPFNQKSRLDRRALEKLVEWHIEEGTEGIVCCGSTGEGVCLDERERRAVVEICVKTAGKKIPIIAGTGSGDTRSTIKYTQQAQKMGADGCLVVTPYYTKPSQRGCILHFQEVSKVGLPIIVYHNPSRTMVRLKEGTVAEISRLPHVVGLKDSSQDAEFIKKVSQYLPVLAGDDDFTLPCIKNGGVGAIGVIGNIIPRPWKQLIHLALKNEWTEAVALFQRYLPLCKALFLESNPQPVKYAVSWMNRCKAIYRLPLVIPTEDVQEEVRKALLSLALPHMNLSEEFFDDQR